MTEERSLCIRCAWRADCQKRFRFESSGQRNCPDYTRDLTIPRDKDEKKDPES
jgi:hypothetical protein